MTIIKHPEKRKRQLRFDDYLRMLPSPWVFEHFLKKGAGTRRILSSSVMLDRGRHFARPETLAGQFAALSPDLRLRCSLAYLMGETGCAAPGGSGGLSDPLVCSFLAYAAKNSDGDIRYFGFDEFEQSMRRAFAETIATAARAKARPRSATPPDGVCVSDLAVVAGLASQGVLVRKRQGGLMRNALQKIARLTHGGRTEQEAGRIADLLVCFGRQAGLLCESEEMYRCRGDAAEEWLARTPEEQRAALVDFACSFAGSWRLDLLREILLNTGDAWLSCSVFPAEDRPAAADALRILNWAGLVETASAGNDLLFKAAGERPAFTHQVPAGAGVVVLPDFSVIISPETRAGLLYRFAKLGSFQSLDRVYKGALDRDILNDSLANGLSGETVFAWLAGWQAPPNVLTTVREWVREFNRLYIAESPLLVAADEKVAYQVGAYEPLRGLLSPVPAHAVFRIKRGCGEQVKQIIAGMGYDCRMPDPDRCPPDGQVPAEGAPDVETWEPVTRTGNDAPADTVALRGRKYGAGMKKLDLNETIHIVDYAILTGSKLEFAYAGSPLLKNGVYSVTPLTCTRGGEPMLEAAGEGNRKKHFYVRKITAIGVGKS